MRIHKIELHNFRNFENTTFNFAANFSVVIGENGKGKSSLLQSIRLATATFLLGLDEPPRLHIQKEDVRRIDAGKRFAPQKDCFFKAWGELNGESLIWKRTLAREGGRTDYKDAQSLIHLAQNLNTRINIDLHNNLDLPVFCYFSTARLWSESKQSINLKKKGSKLKDGYEKCLDIKSDRLTPLQWIKANYYKTLKGKETADLLNAVLDAISTCVPDWKNLEWDEDSDDLAGIYTDSSNHSQYIPLFYLSDGLRTMAGLVAEIAYRCVILNDHLGKDAVKKSKGVVMINEIDMHLHPNWQRRVISDLKSAFPEMQFIVTTHSPFIVQSVSQQELLNLDTATAFDPNTLGLEEVAQGIMGVDNTRSKYYQKYFEIASEYLSLLDKFEIINSAEKFQIIERLNEIEADFQQDPAYAAFLKLNRTAKLGNQ